MSIADSAVEAENCSRFLCAVNETCPSWHYAILLRAQAVVQSRLGAFFGDLADLEVNSSNLN